MVVLQRKDESVGEVLAPHTITVTDEDPRSARNMLRPFGIPQNAWIQEEWTPISEYPEWVREVTAPCLILGETKQRKLPIFSPNGCLPDRVGALIGMEWAVRRVQVDELAKVKGIPEEWITQGILMTCLVNQLTDLHIWTAAASSLAQGKIACNVEQSLPMNESDPDTMIFILTDDLKVDPEEWEWSPTDLSTGGAWHTAQLESLAAAITGRADAKWLREQRLEALETHRTNYEGDGDIKRLQILWWEFPPEHWEELRCGCPMNFLTEPTKGVTQNAPMTAEATGRHCRRIH